MNPQKMTCAQAKEMDMVDYLSTLGYEPEKIRNTDYWYLSPLRDEKTPSFKVDRKRNWWYDHGLGKGGSLVDFGIEYFHCTTGELLEKLSSSLSFHQPVRQSIGIADEPESRIKVVGNFALSSFGLLRYLAERRIPVEIADQYCREVRYELNTKTYYGIGFKNDSGGFEIRNPFYKTSSAPKDITTFANGAKEVVVMEGFFDFLSFMSINKNIPADSFDFVVLNSVALFERARPFMEQHDGIRLFLDRDATGQNCSRFALSISNKYTDESSLYANHKDLNEWLVSFGKPPKKHISHKM